MPVWSSPAGAPVVSKKEIPGASSATTGAMNAFAQSFPATIRRAQEGQGESGQSQPPRPLAPMGVDAEQAHRQQETRHRDSPANGRRGRTATHWACPGNSQSRTGR